MDLGSLDVATRANEGIDYHVLHPVTRQPMYHKENEGAEPLPMTVRILGEQSEAFQKAQRVITNRRLAARGRGKVSAEEIEAESLETLCKCIIGWSNIFLSGKKLEFSYANALQLMGDRRFAWLRKQIDEAIGDESNFLPS